MLQVAPFCLPVQFRRQVKGCLISGGEGNEYLLNGIGFSYMLPNMVPSHSNHIYRRPPAHRAKRGVMRAASNSRFPPGATGR